MIDLREMTVLVTDDMENMYKSIRSIMRVLKFGRKFFYAPNGEEGLKVLQKEAIDLAILDNNMPGMKGVELLGIIRDDKKMRDMPVVMITADATMEFVTKAAETDIDAYLIKPITVELLRAKIPPVIEMANNPLPMVVHLKKAAQFEEEGNLDAAIEEAKRAQEANPKSSRPIRELGRCFLKMGRYEEAEEYLLKAAQMNKVDVVAFHYLGDLYLKQDNIDQALKYFHKAVEISPRNLERGINLGKILIQKKMLDKAAPIFNKVFQISKDPLNLKEEIADFCIEQGARSYAAKVLKSVIDQDKGRSSSLLKLGVLAEAAGNSEQAIAHFMEAEKHEPANIDIKIHIAKNYLLQGMVIRAEKPLNAILDMDPDNKEARELLQQCL